METVVFSFNSQQCLDANVDPFELPGWEVTILMKKV